jgi:hypothetical protein
VPEGGERASSGRGRRDHGESSGLDVVELAAREQGDEGSVDFGGVVIADEEPFVAIMASSA